MDLIRDKIIEILLDPPSEEPCIEYKLYPYRDNQKHEFLKDVISMLNSEMGMWKDKFIIIGVVDKSRFFKGVKEDDLKDDNEWQNVIDIITPRPNICTGSVVFDDKTFGWIYIPASNDEWVYEAFKSQISDQNDYVCESNIIAKGQAYIRRGTRKDVLLDIDRRHLLWRKEQGKRQEKQQEEQRQDLIKKNGINDDSTMVSMSLVGAWTEGFAGDIKIVEGISEIGIKNFIKDTRVLFENNLDLLDFSQGCWRLRNHKSILLKEAKHIYDDHIDLFFNMFTKCIEEYDPRFDLPPNDRPFSSAYSCKKKGYSKALCQGLAETMAILGNNERAFVNCTSHKIINRIYEFEKQFFSVKDWRIYATFADEIQFLGEASPSAFLNEIDRLLYQNDFAFKQFLEERENGLIATQYIYPMGHTIANIARNEEFFSKAFRTLFLLAKINNWFVDVIVQLIMPWYLQTTASDKIILASMKESAMENDTLAWDILMKLMPGVTTTTIPFPQAIYLDIKNIKEEHNREKYKKLSDGYIRIAVLLVGENVDRMSSMISVLDNVEDDIRMEILQNIKKSAENINEEKKAVLWNEIRDFLCKHRKHSDSQWALSEKQLKPIEDLSKWLFPDDKYINSIRLFQRNQYKLIDYSDNYNDARGELEKKQIHVLKEIYDQTDREGLFRFISNVENKRVAGICSATFLCDQDIEEAINYSSDIINDAFLDGIVTHIGFSRIQYILCGFSDEIKAQIVAKYPISDESIRYIYELNERSQNQYWDNANADFFAIEDPQILSEAVRKFNEKHRTDKSINVLYDAIILGDNSVTADLVIDTLSLNIQYQDSVIVDVSYIQRLIKWLQNKDIDQESISSIEWKYLSILGESEGYPPICLWDKLSSNADFFVEVLSIIYSKEKGTTWTEDERKIIATRCFNLIFGWKIPPGLDFDGKINKEKLDNWVIRVKELSSVNKLEDRAMYYFGKTAFHAPVDPDGYFIDRNIASYLQGDKDGHIRSGYHSEAINSRGAYFVDPTGKSEFAIEESYRVKARIADENSMSRFADTLRDIADFYHEEGEENKREENS